MDRQYFYQIPTPLDRHPYLQWQIDPRLRRYIYQRIPDDLARSQVLEIAQILVVELCQLATLDLPNYTPTQKCLRGCITALLAQTLFLDRSVGAKVHLQIRRQIFEPLQLHFQETELEDVYQTGLSIICHPAQFLKNFQPDRLDWYQSFATYSYYKFRQSLIDRLRTLPNAADFKRTNLGLLYRTSIESALKECEPAGARFEGLLLLYQCFREAVIAKQFVTNQPQPSHYDALLARYRSHPESGKLEIVDRAMTIELLQYLGNTLRNYRQIGTYSLDTTVGDNDSGKTFGDLQAAPPEVMTIEDTEIRERAIQFLDRQPPNSVLMLIYGLELNQEDAGIELGLNQTTIGRQAKRSIAKLAQAFYVDCTPIESARDAWVAPMAGEPSRCGSALSVEVLAKYVDYLTWVCEDYYPTLLTTMLTEILADCQIAASTVDIFVDRIETQWQFKFKLGGVGSSKIFTFVQQHQQRGKWARNDDIHPSLQLQPEHTQI
jgi:RNA polymerase sigma factor (sigma-70 family)